MWSPSPRSRFAFPLYILFTLSLSAGRARAMHSPAPESVEESGPAEWELRMAAAHSRVQEAQESFDAVLAWAADTEGFWAVWAKAEAHLLLAKATLRQREAEAAQIESQFHLRKRALHLGRNLHYGPWSTLRGAAVINHCEARSERALGRALLLGQEANALAVQGETRLWMASAMSWVTDCFSHLTTAQATGPEAKPDLHLGAARGSFTHAVESCRRFVDQMRRADETAGVHIDFLDIQMAYLECVLQEMEKLDLQITALEEPANAPV